jgi:hypothetical protein
LSAFARWWLDGEFFWRWLGDFDRQQVVRGDGVVHLPRGYFPDVVFDGPLPTRVPVGQMLPVSGQVLLDSAVTICFSFRPAAGDTIDVWLEIDEEGRFAGDLELADAAPGRYRFDLFLGGPSGFGPWKGAAEYFHVGDAPITAVRGESTSAPPAFSLHPNYPNPFNGTTQIPIDVAVDGDVRLEVFTVHGQRVAVLVDGKVTAGRHIISWEGRSRDGRALASGIYLARLRAEQGSRTRRLLLLR